MEITTYSTINATSCPESNSADHICRFELKSNSSFPEEGLHKFKTSALSLAFQGLRIKIIMVFYGETAVPHQLKSLEMICGFDFRAECGGNRRINHSYRIYLNVSCVSPASVFGCGLSMLDSGPPLT